MVKQYSVMVKRKTLELDRIWILDPSFTGCCDHRQIICVPVYCSEIGDENNGSGPHRVVGKSR